MSSRSISSGRNKVWRLCAAAVAIATAASANARPGGDPADTLRFPFVAALSRTTGENRVYFCAGALIAPQWILTAAHCFHNPGGARISGQNLWAEAGSDWLKEVPDQAQVRVERVILHPDYNRETQDNDLALVHLEREVGPLVATLATAGPARDPARAIVIGFGSFYEGQLAANALAPGGAPAAQMSDRLRQAGVALIAPAECAARLNLGGAATGAVQICAGARPDDACVGDSGGPLIVEAADRSDHLAGVVSFGTGCAVDSPVTVFTRVSAYSRWIAGVIATH